MLDLKETTVAIFEEAKFELHKWHSNESVLEAKSEPDDGKQSYAKDQLGVKAREAKLLGLPWNKNNYTISVTFPQPIAETTKREMLRFLASIYDPLGLVSPITLSGKLMCCIGKFVTNIYPEMQKYRIASQISGANSRIAYLVE